MPYSRVSFQMILSDVKWFSEIYNATKPTGYSYTRKATLWHFCAKYGVRVLSLFADFTTRLTYSEWAVRHDSTKRLLVPFRCWHTVTYAVLLDIVRQQAVTSEGPDWESYLIQVTVVNYCLPTVIQYSTDKTAYYTGGLRLADVQDRDIGRFSTRLTAAKLAAKCEHQATERTKWCWYQNYSCCHHGKRPLLNWFKRAVDAIM